GRPSGRGRGDGLPRRGRRSARRRGGPRSPAPGRTPAIAAGRGPAARPRAVRWHRRSGAWLAVASFRAAGLLQAFDPDLAELVACRVRLEADRPLGEVAHARADRGVVDLRADGAVGGAGDLGGVPLPDGPGCLVLGGLVVFRLADLLAAEEVEDAVVGV